MDERPLITFALFTYNQEQFIKESVRGALFQTYSPLEIILSDDGSSDRTYDIMSKMASEYKGPHTIILNRNVPNLGLGGHINRIMELARGQLIIGAAGDDISAPERTEKIWQVYRDSDGKAMSIYSDVKTVDEFGHQGSVIKKPLDPNTDSPIHRYDNLFYGVLGCSHAWHRKVFDVFGGMLDDTIIEDKVIPFRSSLLGEIRHLPECLVFYRIHYGALSQIHRSRSRLLHGDSNPSNERANFRIQKIRRLNMLKNYLKDITIESDEILLHTAQKSKLKKSIQKEISWHEIEIAYTEGNLKDRLLLIAKGSLNGLSIGRIAELVLHPSLFLFLYRLRTGDWSEPE